MNNIPPWRKPGRLRNPPNLNIRTTSPAHLFGAGYAEKLAEFLHHTGFEFSHITGLQKFLREDCSVGMPASLAAEIAKKETTCCGGALYESTSHLPML